MSTFLDDIPESTQHIFVTLAESLEDGEQLPTETLIAYLRHPEDAIRKLTVELLEYSNDPAAIPALLEAAADPNIEISIAAGEVLRSFRNLVWIDRLEPLLADPDPGVQKSARRAIEKLASVKRQIVEL